METSTLGMGSMASFASMSSVSSLRGMRVAEKGKTADRVSTGDLLRSGLSRAAELMGERWGDGAELMLDVVDGKTWVLIFRAKGGVLCLGLGVGFWIGLGRGLRPLLVGFLLIISHSGSCSLST